MNTPGHLTRFAAMAVPARDVWWDDVVSVDSVKLNDWTHLLWGDRSV